MTPTEFDAAYDPERKCYATYRDACGDRLSGLIIDGRHRGVTNVDFAYIDNFTQGIPLARIEKIYRTKEAWI